MPKIILLLILCCFTALFASAQQKLVLKGDSIIKTDSLAKGDSLKRKKPADTVKYINYGKIAAKKALFRSLVIPGWGQVTNGLNVYRALKVAAIYGGGAVLYMSYKSNTKNYHYYLTELQYRETHNGVPPAGSKLAGITDESSIVTAKEVYRRNREVVIFSLIGVYAVNVLDAFIDARLKYFEVDNNLAMKISPTVISPNSMLGFNNSSSYAPALKIAFRL